MSIERTSNTMEDFETDFNLVYDEVAITLHKKDDPVPWECIIREMDGTNRDLFLDGQKGKVKMSTREITSFKDLQTSLIARCLYDKATDKLVSPEEIRKFPSKVQNKLYNMCVKMNALNENTEEEQKNS